MTALAWKKDMTKPMINSAISSLSARQQEVLNKLAEGETYMQIAGEMGLSIHTVRNHVRRIYLKLEVHNCAQAVAKNRLW